MEYNKYCKLKDGIGKYYIKSIILEINSPDYYSENNSYPSLKYFYYYAIFPCFPMIQWEFKCDESWVEKKWAVGNGTDPLQETVIEKSY